MSQPTYEGWSTESAWETHLAITNDSKRNQRLQQLLRTALSWGASVEVFAWHLAHSFPERNAPAATWLELAEDYLIAFAHDMRVKAIEYVRELGTDGVVSRSHETLRAGRKQFSRRAFDAEVAERTSD